MEYGNERMATVMRLLLMMISTESYFEVVSSFTVIFRLLQLQFQKQVLHYVPMCPGPTFSSRLSSCAQETVTAGELANQSIVAGVHLVGKQLVFCVNSDRAPT